MRRHMERQRDFWGVILLVFLVVLLYSAWGATLLKSQAQADSGAQKALATNG